MLASTGTRTASTKLPVLVQFVHGLREDHVSPRLDAGDGPVDGRVDALHGQRVGARHDHEVPLPRVGGGLDAVDHLAFRHNGLAGAVAAALGLHLVLDVAAGGARADQFAHGAGNIEGAGAEARVRVHQQRQRRHVGDAAHVLQNVVQRADAQIRQAQRAGRHPSPGEVECTVAGVLGQRRVIGVDRAHHLQGAFLLHRRAQPGAGGIWGRS
jgi:hypothetical protein